MLFSNVVEPDSSIMTAIFLSSTIVSNWCFNKSGNRDMSLVLLNTAVQMASTNPEPLGVGAFSRLLQYIAKAYCGFCNIFTLILRETTDRGQILKSLPRT